MSDALSLSQASVRKRQTEIALPMATPSVLFAGAIALLTFGTYLATMAPGLYTLDSPELTTAAYKLGIAHAPGYPLYTLVGWLFSHAFPIGSVAFRMNLLSALLASAAAVVTYGVALKVTLRPALAATAALLLAFSYHFWINALIAEVYALDAMLFAGMLLAALSWRESGSVAMAAGVGLLLGLSLATRTVAVLYVPALVAFALMARDRDVRSYAGAVAATVAGLSFYLYLPIRSALGTDVGPGVYDDNGRLTVTDLATWGGFWDHITAASFRSDAFAYGAGGAFGEAGNLLQWVTWAFLVVGLPLGLVGIARLWREDRPLLVLLAGTGAPIAVFFVNYGVADKEFMFAPVYIVWALFVAAGLREAFDAMPAAWKQRSLVMASPLLLAVVAVAVNAPRVSLNGDDSVRGESEELLRGLAPEAILYGSFADVAKLQYLQSVEGMRPDVAIVNNWEIDDRAGYLRSLAAKHQGGRPLYVTQDEPAVRRLYQLVQEGAVYRVTARAPR